MKELDPVQYEIYRHRLFNILEEGRIAIRMVSGSPVVVEGGECLTSFYTTDGVPVLTAAGVLLHCTGARDFLLRCIEWYEQDPGIFEGDQIFFNDPYIGGTHLPDHIILKPIFYQGKRIAWTACFMHTPETGGMEPGGMMPGSSSIYQEGIRFLGLKIVERGKFRPEVFRNITETTRDPVLVGLDTKAKIAGNNVCARNYLQLVEKYELDFVEAANERIIRDSELKARARLRRLPDGVWRACVYGDNSSLKERPFKVMCTMTKKGDEICFDYTGSSRQNEGSINLARPGAWCNVFVAVASQLFWDVPWNGGMVAPVKAILPEGTVVNCSYPAAVSSGTGTIGRMISETACECIAKMLYAAGIYEDVNSSWVAMSHGPIFTGINQYGNRFSGMLLEMFASGIGATPQRDGVDTGANRTNPTSTIADVEMIEMNLPFMYVSRRQCTDSGGFGKFAGGMGGETILMVHGGNEIELGMEGEGRRVPSSLAMFGGYPAGLQEVMFVLNSDIRHWFAQSKSPTTMEELYLLNGEKRPVPASYSPIPVKDYDLLAYRWAGGGGYGDPLDRDPEKVVCDVSRQAISIDTAKLIYGVQIEPKTLRINREETKKLRKTLREERLAEGRRLRPPLNVAKDGTSVRKSQRIAEYLELKEWPDGRKLVCCLKCGYAFHDPSENYKLYALLRERSLSNIKMRSLLCGAPPFVLYQEFICPGCATLLEVDTNCPTLDPEQIIWDMQLAIEDRLC